MSNSIIPFNFESHEVRALTIDNEPWFVAKDICAVLGLTNVGQALASLDDDEKSSITTNDGTPGNPVRAVINEPGLYSLILRSRKPQAKTFKRWVTHDVIPSIRKTGGYTAPTLTDEQIVAQALQITTAKVKELEAKVEIDAPKVEYVDTFVPVDDDVLTVRDSAQTLGVKESLLRDALSDWGWVYRKHVGQRWSDSKQRMADVYEWRAYADHVDKFQLRPQHNAPRHHNGQVRQTLYVRSFALPKIAARLGVDAEQLIGEVV